MNILPIEKITELEKLELDKIKEQSKHRPLTDSEAAREIFLDVKQFWNCEC